MRRITASISKGKLAPAHNRRECYAENCPDHIDQERTPENVTFIDRDISEVYEELFGQALEEYNQKQVEKGHAERQIDDYLEKVRSDKKLNEAYEYVIQIGNKDDQLTHAEAVRIYKEWLTEFQARYSQNFVVVQAIVHLDEATPHMHLELVPVAYSKRGLAVQNSLNKALAQAQGGEKDYKGWLAELDGLMGKVMNRHMLERVAGDKDKQLGGVDIHTFKETMAWRDGVREEAEKEAAEKVHAAEIQAQNVKAAGIRAKSQAARKGKEIVKAANCQALETMKEANELKNRASVFAVNTRAAGQRQKSAAARKGKAILRQARHEVAEVNAEKDKAQAALAELAEKRDTALRQLRGAEKNKELVDGYLSDTSVKLGAANKELKEKQASSAALDDEIAKKTAEKAGIIAEIADFSTKRDTAKAEEAELNDRLERLRLDEERDSSVEGEYQQLKDQERDFEAQNRELEEFVRTGGAGYEPEGNSWIREERAGLEERCRVLGEHLGALVERVKEFFEEIPIPDSLVAAMREFGLRASVAPRTLDEHEQGYDLASLISDERDAWAHSSRRNRGKGYDDPII